MQYLYNIGSVQYDDLWDDGLNLGIDRPNEGAPSNVEVQLRCFLFLILAARYAHRMTVSRIKRHVTLEGYPALHVRRKTDCRGGSISVMEQHAISTSS